MTQPQPLYTVEVVQGRLILDPASRPVEGYHIDFVTRSGFHGFVEIIKSRYTNDYVKQRLTEEATRLEAIGQA